MNVLEKQKTKISTRTLVVILSCITVAAVAITIWALFFRAADVVLSPDYAPQALESYAEPLGDEGDEKLEQEEGGGAVSLSYATAVSISLTSNTASLYFANPTKSNQDVLIQIVIQDTVILQSGLLVPGNKVQTLDLLSGIQLEEGVYEGKFNILYYQQNSGEKAILNTEIPIEITVVQ